MVKRLWLFSTDSVAGGVRTVFFCHLSHRLSLVPSHFQFFVVDNFGRLQKKKVEKRWKGGDYYHDYDIVYFK